MHTHRIRRPTRQSHNARGIAALRDNARATNRARVLPLARHLLVHSHCRPSSNLIHRAVPCARAPFAAPTRQSHNVRGTAALRGSARDPSGSSLVTLPPPPSPLTPPPLLQPHTSSLPMRTHSIRSPDPPIPRRARNHCVGPTVPSPQMPPHSRGGAPLCREARCRAGESRPAQQFELAHARSIGLESRRRSPVSFTASTNPTTTSPPTANVEPVHTRMLALQPRPANAVTSV